MGPDVKAGRKGENCQNGNLEADARSTDLPKEDDMLLAQRRIAEAERFLSFWGSVMLFKTPLKSKEIYSVRWFLSENATDQLFFPFLKGKIE